MDNKKEYENAVPPNLDEPMQWLFYKQKYALFLLFLFVVCVFIYSRKTDLLYILIILFAICSILLASANKYYTIGYTFWRYFLSIYIEPLEYLKISRKELKANVKNKKTKRNRKTKISRKKT